MWLNNLHLQVHSYILHNYVLKLIKIYNKDLHLQDLIPTLAGI